MSIFFRYLLILVITIFLSSCAGTGNTYLNKSEINDSSNSNKLYVYREKGFKGSGNVPTVFYHNKKIGSIGVGEYLSANINKSFNTIEVKTTGFMGFGMYGATKSFDNKSNKYFLISYEEKLLTTGWVMIEISKSQFESYF